MALLLLVIGIVLYRYVVEIQNFRGWDTGCKFDLFTFCLEKSKKIYFFKCEKQTITVPIDCLYFVHNCRCFLKEYVTKYLYI